MAKNYDKDISDIKDDIDVMNTTFADIMERLVALDNRFTLVEAVTDFGPAISTDPPLQETKQDPTFMPPGPGQLWCGEDQDIYVLSNEDNAGYYCVTVVTPGGWYNDIWNEAAITGPAVFDGYETFRESDQGPGLCRSEEI